LAYAIDPAPYVTGSGWLDAGKFDLSFTLDVLNELLGGLFHVALQGSCQASKCSPAID
jgi:hypothetical protein